MGIEITLNILIIIFSMIIDIFGSITTHNLFIMEILYCVILYLILRYGHNIDSNWVINCILFHRIIMKMLSKHTRSGLLLKIVILNCETKIFRSYVTNNRLRDDKK